MLHRQFTGVVARCFSSAARAEFSPNARRQTDLQGLGPRVFYKKVAVLETDTKRYAVTVDGATVRTPQRTRLELPTAALAEAVAAEWAAQEGRIRPSSMPLTILSSTALDVVPESRERIEASTLAFLQTDTVCIRPAHPTELVEHQDEVLGAVVNHFASKYGIHLNVVRGTLSAPQDSTTARYFEQIVRKADPFTLAALDSATATAKSVVIAAALGDGAVDPDAALEAARSEERWQARVWGEVEGGHDMDDSDTLVRLSAADLIFRLVELDRAAFQRNKLSAI